MPRRYQRVNQMAPQPYSPAMRPEALQRARLTLARDLIQKVIDDGVLTPLPGYVRDAHAALADGLAAWQQAHPGS
jgi:hypothetical protein